MDRSVLEGDPHSVIEAMAIAAYAIGAKQGYVYVRAEYPLAVERLGKAIDQAREYGLLGKNILGTGFDFDLEIRMGSGAFVCGEETALMTSIEGNRGEPRPRPPFPANKGLWGKPSLLNNVETYANIPPIILKGRGVVRLVRHREEQGHEGVRPGRERSTTPAWSRSRSGIPLGEIIYRHRRRHPGRQEVQGGPDRRSVRRLHPEGAPERAGRLRVAHGARRDHGLGRPDRHGRGHLHGRRGPVLPRLRPGRVLRQVRALPHRARSACWRSSTGSARARARRTTSTSSSQLGNQIKDTALCGLGQTAPEPGALHHPAFPPRVRWRTSATSTARRASARPSFGRRARTPVRRAWTCRASCRCVGEKRYAEALQLHRERNPFAAVCARVCFHPCEDKCRRATLDEPVSIRGLKRFMVEQEVTIQLPEVRENEREREAQDRHRRRRARRACPAPTSSPGWATGRRSSRPSTRPAACWCRRFPAYRLPREVLAREIRMIEQLGRRHRDRTCSSGRDFTLEELRDAGLRGGVPRRGRARGIAARHPRRGRRGRRATPSSFLRDYNLGGSAPVGRTVVVIGGGNVAIDAARTALRLGAETVTRPLPPDAGGDARLRGGDRGGRATRASSFDIPRRADARSSRKDGEVTGVQVPAHGARASSTERPAAARGDAGRSEFVVEADQVIAAIGQSARPDEILRRARAEAHRQQLHRGEPGDRADVGGVGLRRRRRGDRARLGGRGHRRRASRPPSASTSS